MPHLIISPCGTSVLTNEADHALRSLLNHNANKKVDEVSADDLGRINERIVAVRNDSQSWSVEDARKKSAELNSLLLFYKGQPENFKDTHYLVKTDTYLGDQTAQIIRSYLESVGHTVQVFDIRDLQTVELESFQFALSELTKELSNLVPGYRESGYEIVFNLTGGFKCIQGFLQILAMLYADKTIYTFERTDSLLEIPSLPVKLDEEQCFRDHLDTFRQLSLHLPVAEVTVIPAIYLLKVDSELALSAWGEVAWGNAKNSLYGNKLLEPPCERICFGDGFRKDVQGVLEKVRIRELNERIDDFARYLETGKLLKSLNFKALKGTPKKLSTHEFYVNSDNAQRVYLHREVEVWILDEYGEHL